MNKLEKTFRTIVDRKLDAIEKSSKEALVDSLHMDTGNMKLSVEAERIVETDGMCTIRARVDGDKLERIGITEYDYTKDWLDGRGGKYITVNNPANRAMLEYRGYRFTKGTNKVFLPAQPPVVGGRWLWFKRMNMHVRAEVKKATR